MLSKKILHFLYIWNNFFFLWLLFKSEKSHNFSILLESVTKSMSRFFFVVVLFLKIWKRKALMVLAVFEMSWIWGLRNSFNLVTKDVFFPLYVFPLSPKLPFYANRVTFLTGLSSSPRFPGSVPELLLIIAKSNVLSSFWSWNSVVKNPTLGFNGPVQVCLPCSLTGWEQLHRTWPPWTPRGSGGVVSGGWQSAPLPTAHSLRGRAKWSTSVAAITPVSMLVFLKLGINSCLLKCEVTTWASKDRHN